MITLTDWDLNRLENGTYKLVGEIQLRAYGLFLEEYTTQLHGIKEALEDSIGNSWDMSCDPISLELMPFEKCAIQEIIDTDNKILNKVLTVFTSLCLEVRSLQAEAENNFYGTLLFYGEGEVLCPRETNDACDGALWSLMKNFHYLQELVCFIKRCEELLVQMVQQLAAVYIGHHESSQVMNAIDIHFQDVFDHLGDLLIILITLDEILGNHSALKEHWNIFKRTIVAVHHDPVKFKLTLEKLSTFEKVISDLEHQLLSGKIFLRAVEQIFDNELAQASRNSVFVEEFSLYLKNSINDLELKTSEKVISSYPLVWVKLSALFVLNFHLFGTVDKKLFKQLWDIHKKIPVVSLTGNVLWLPEDFLLSHFPNIAKTVDRKTLNNVVTCRMNYLQHKSMNMSQEAYMYCLQTFSWMVQLENSVKQEAKLLKLEDLVDRCKLFMQGVKVACTINHLLKTVTNLHVCLSKPMTKTMVIALCKMIELLKGILYMYHRHFIVISESTNHVIQHLSFRILNIIATAKKGLAQDKKYSEKHLDILSSLFLAEKTLHGPITKERYLVLRLALCAANQMKTFHEDELVQLGSLLHKLNIICNIQEKLSSACDCSFLYWHRVILPIYFSNIYESKAEVNNILYMFCALQDCLISIQRTKQHSTQALLTDLFDKEVDKSLREQVIQPLCHETETNLRLHVHSHLHLDDKNPFRVGIGGNLPLLNLRPLWLFKKLIHIKGHVEHYLQETFYNLTTVALHDWKTYGEMRTLACHKFCLETVENHLPSQTLEQGLDVLEIMRNIHIFVSKYLYNLNNQIFIEQSSNNKHLNTINIRHVANSIRTHGTGIMNTTVNFTYQFLRKKFFIFSQFMYDEHIKSRLIKDLRFFRDNKALLEQKYSYERADKFNKGIRKLGLTADGLSFLDQFRMLISHIGNAMGYVRMIRSGGLHCCSNAICFIPDLEDIVSFEELCIEEGLSLTSRQGAEKLDQVISNLTRNFAEGTGYFKLLVDVFAPVFRDPKNLHLRNFYMILPPLTINFVEHSITSKEKMSKKKKCGVAFTDDGFAMGVAYILKLLNQCAEFDSLHWFQSVTEKYNNDKLMISKQKTVASRDDEKLQQTMTLTAKRLDMYLQEFDLLHYSLSSARIFFEKDKPLSEGLKSVVKV